MNLLSFVENRKQVKADLQTMNEALKQDDWNDALDKITALLKKKVSNLVYAGPMQIAQKDANYVSYQYIVNHNTENPFMFSLNAKLGKSVNIYSIDFYKDIKLFTQGKGKTALTLYTMGVSVAYFLPVIIDVCNTHNFKLSNEKIEKLTSKMFSESFDYWIGAMKYGLVSNLNEDVIDTAFSINERMGDEEVQAYRDSKRKEKEDKLKDYISNGRKDKSEYNKIEKEYYEIVQAIKGGADTMPKLKKALAKVGIEVGVVTTEVMPDEVKQIERDIDLKKSPKQAFKEMARYLKMVIGGVQTGLILCGAPGVGKTYRVMKTLEANGYEDDERRVESEAELESARHGCHVIKGKITPASLYNALFMYKNEDDILIVDDADSVVGPGASDDAINILKAALDSSEKRKVSYNIRTKIYDNRYCNGNVELPKSFIYKGRIIIITNYNVGQLDTALKGRTFTQSLEFTTDQLLEIIADVMPSMATKDPGKIDAEYKNMAYDYLVEMNKKGEKMEISFRTFLTCAKIFQLMKWDDEMTEKDARSMIKEQMFNQAIRGGKKY